MATQTSKQPITVLDLALYRGARQAADGTVNGGEIERVGLPILGGCEVCGATVAAYNASPSKTGYLRCSGGCIGNVGYATVQEANTDIFGDTEEIEGDNGRAAMDRMMGAEENNG